MLLNAIANDRFHFAVEFGAASDGLCRLRVSHHPSHGTQQYGHIAQKFELFAKRRAEVLRLGVSGAFRAWCRVASNMTEALE